MSEEDKKKELDDSKAVEKAEKSKKSRKTKVKQKKAGEPEVDEEEVGEESEELKKATAGEELAEVEEVADERVIKKKIKEGEKEILDEERKFLEWKPKTEIGRKVQDGEITSISGVLRKSTPIKEVEIVEKLVSDLDEEVITVDRVQRATDSGRRMRFRVVASVGNRNGLVGVGVAKGKEAGPTIRKAIDRAKLNIKEVKRGCGSWECGCGNPHTVPFTVAGRSGSVEVTLRPAPRGVGLVSGELAKSIISLAGISDVWVITKGHTRTGVNFAKAVFDALVNTNKVKLKKQDIEVLNVVSGIAKSDASSESIQATGE
jgi:small subunit ribosomal protein S5